MGAAKDPLQQNWMGVVYPYSPHFRVCAHGGKGIGSGGKGEGEK